MNRQRRSKKTDQAAREWLVTLESGSVSQQTWQRFDHWLNADPRHQVAYDLVTGISLITTQMKDLAVLEPRESPRRSGYTYRYWAMAAAVLVAILGVWQLQPRFAGVLWENGHYQTAIAETRVLKLSDRSVITLGARSHIEIDYGSDRRSVALKQGEAFFEVAKDENRPFVVAVGQTQVQAIGTQFNIHTDPSRITVAVTEGAVEVSKEQLIVPDRLRQIVKAGQQVTASYAGELEPVEPLQVGRAGRWRSGQLIYENAPLREVIADVRRYSTNHISLENHAVGELTVTISFKTTAVNHMVEALPKVLPVVIDWQASNKLLIRLKHGEG